MHLKDKIVVITGGSLGFGRALARSFVANGSIVLISSNTKNTLDKAKDDLSVDSFLADVSSFDEVEKLVKYTLGKYSRVDIWVNNAGIQIAPSAVEDVDNSKFENLLKVNFFGYFYGIKAVLPTMKKQKSGTIININSTAGLDGKPGLSAYSASKFAIRGLTESVRAELSSSNIKIYGVFPGGMQTDIYKEKVPIDIKEYMSVEYAVEKVIENLKNDNPVEDLVIRRPIK